MIKERNNFLHNKATNIKYRMRLSCMGCMKNTLHEKYLLEPIDHDKLLKAYNKAEGSFY